MSEPLLAGKTALITGAARRVGAVLARTLHAAGANVLVHYRSSAREAAALAGELNAARPKSAALVQADLADPARLPGVVEAALALSGSLDILVNNASTFYPTPLGSITPAQFDDLVGSNLKAPLFLSQAGAPALRATRGLIVNLVDIHALRPLRDYAVYCAAKAGLHMLTRALAKELGPEIRVNGISPGPVLWAEGTGAAQRARIVEATVLKRMGSPEDIARTALFFATQAPYVTGQILAVDGGRSVDW